MIADHQANTALWGQVLDEAKNFRGRDMTIDDDGGQFGPWEVVGLEVRILRQTNLGSSPVHASKTIRLPRHPAVQTSS